MQKLMKKILILIVCLLVVNGCSSNDKNKDGIVTNTPSFDNVEIEEPISTETIETENIIVSNDVDKEVDLAKEIVGEWYVIMGEYANEVLSFSNDGALILTETNINQQEVSHGSYQIKDNKLSFSYTRADSSTNKGEISVDICGNVLILSDWGILYCRMGETPNTTNKYTKQLEGYYSDGEYCYHFSSNGELQTSDVFYYYAANKDGFVAVIPAGASSGTISGTFELDQDGNILNINNISRIGERFLSLVNINKDEYINATGDITDNYLLLVTADALKVRKSPSLNGEQTSVYFKGKVISSNEPFETVDADGYTWYKIGINWWVADNNGEWIKQIK